MEKQAVNISISRRIVTSLLIGFLVSLFLLEIYENAKCEFDYSIEYSPLPHQNYIVGEAITRDIKTTYIRTLKLKTGFGNRVEWRVGDMTIAEVVTLKGIDKLKYTHRALFGPDIVGFLLITILISAGIYVFQRFSFNVEVSQ